jgi:WD40 repeat protein
MSLDYMYRVRRYRWLVFFLALTFGVGFLAWTRVLPHRLAPAGEEGMQCLRKIHIGGASSFAVTFSQDGSLLVADQVTSERWKNAVGLWEVATGKLRRSLTGIEWLVGGVGISVDNAHVAIRDGNNESDTRTLWDARTGVVKQRWTGKEVGLRLALHPTQKLWAYDVFGKGPDAGTVQVVLANYESGQVLHRLPHGKTAVHSMTFSPDGRTLATGGDDAKVRLWDVASGKLNQVLQGHHHLIVSVAYAPTGKMLASGGGNTVNWRRETEVMLWQGDPLRGVALDTHHSRLYSLAFSRDGRFLVTAGGLAKGELAVWDTATGRRLWQGKARHPYWSVACSPSEDLVAAAGQDEEIEIWDFSGLREKLEPR